MPDMNENSESQQYWKGFHPVEKNEVRNHNVGNSDYSEHKIQPWDIWNEYKLNPFDADIVKRILRKKKGDTRKMDYEKIIHICQERIRQIDSGEDVWDEFYNKISEEKNGRKG